MSDKGKTNSKTNGEINGDTLGLSGLENIGNTCYMNSVLQCLSATDILNQYLRSKMFKNDLKNGINRKIIKDKKSVIVNFDEVSSEVSYIPKCKTKYRFKNSITYRLYQLVKILWNINCDVIPRKFKATLDELIPNFRGYSQQDSHEFFSLILDTLHEEFKTDIEILEIKQPDNIDYDKINILDNGIKFYTNFIKNNHSIILDIFYGIFVFEIKCLTCDNHNYNYEPFNTIELDLYDFKSIDECLQKYFISSEVDYNCSKCNTNNTKALKTQSIFLLPNKLCIQLKRFKKTESRGEIHTHKISNHIEFPLVNLQMTQFYNSDKSSYNLYGIVNHSGSLSGGHYISYTKNIITGDWYEFNDSRVIQVKNPNSIINSGAYLLFYEKNVKFF
jgi:ubiquitin carboxyl-terminal hydrolase 8